MRSGTQPTRTTAATCRPATLMTTSVPCSISRSNTVPHAAQCWRTTTAQHRGTSTGGQGMAAHLTAHGLPDTSGTRTCNNGSQLRGSQPSGPRSSRRVAAHLHSILAGRSRLQAPSRAVEDVEYERKAQEDSGNFVPAWKQVTAARGAEAPLAVGSPTSRQSGGAAVAGGSRGPVRPMFLCRQEARAA